MSYVFILLTILFACNKDVIDLHEDSTEMYEDVRNSELTIEAAKDYYREVIADGLYKDSNPLLGQEDLELLWDEAYQAKQRNTDFIEVPVSVSRKRAALYNFPPDSLKYVSDRYWHL